MRMRRVSRFVCNMNACMCSSALCNSVIVSNVQSKAVVKDGGVNRVGPQHLDKQDFPLYSRLAEDVRELVVVLDVNVFRRAGHGVRCGGGGGSLRVRWAR